MAFLPGELIADKRTGRVRVVVRTFFRDGGVETMELRPVDGGGRTSFARVDSGGYERVAPERLAGSAPDA